VVRITLMLKHPKLVSPASASNSGPSRSVIGNSYRFANSILNGLHSLHALLLGISLRTDKSGIFANTPLKHTFVFRTSGVDTDS
jgi:hypothetical protein